MLRFFELRCQTTTVQLLYIRLFALSPFPRQCRFAVVSTAYVSRFGAPLLSKRIESELLLQRKLAAFHNEEQSLNVV
jgi:hypothetical protein